jgi:hypothetical protein
MKCALSIVQGLCSVASCRTLIDPIRIKQITDVYSSAAASEPHGRRALVAHLRGERHALCRVQHLNVTPPSELLASPSEL